MPYAYRRRTTRRKSTMRRRPRRVLSRSLYRRRVKTNPRVHHFKRTVIASPISTGTATTFGFFAFRLSNLDDYTEFTNLYDMYRINKVVLKLVPNANNADAGATQRLPQIHSVLDYTNSATPTALTELVQYGNYRMTMGSRIHTRLLTPAWLDDVYAQGSATTSYASPNFKKWLSTDITNAADVAHLGVKYAIGSTATAGAISYTPYITYYLSCKAVK